MNAPADHKKASRSGCRPTLSQVNLRLNMKPLKAIPAVLQSPPEVLLRPAEDVHCLRMDVSAEKKLLPVFAHGLRKPSR